MVKRVVLGRSGEEKVVDLIKDMRHRASDANTSPSGNKVLESDEDVVWGRLDGTEHSLREIDEGLDMAQGRIDEAEAALGETQVRLEGAEQIVADTREDLTRVETVVIPGAVADLEAADQAAQEQFAELDTRLGDFATDEALAPIRQALTDAQAAVEAAQGVAQTANEAANAASQAALEAAGIAASKGRVIVQETEPMGEDRNAANIWIKPVPDDPDTEIEEKAVTYVYLEATNEWQPTTSSELAQAAQNALDAREAAQQATQRAETAISNAAAAQGAAEAAQRTANEATTDAREAHNEAVAARERADALMEAGESLLVNGGFEQGALGWEPHSNRTEIVETADAYAGTHVLRITPHGINTYPYADPVTAATGRTYRITYMVRHDGLDPNGRIRQYNMVRKSDGSQQGQFHPAWRTAGEFPENTWNKVTFDLTVTVPDATHIRFAPHFGISANTYDIDEFRAVDITEALEAQRAADAAQARADEAYTEAASKLSEAQVQAIADATEAAALAAAKAEDELLEARAATEAARVAKAEAAREAGEAEAAAKAYADLIDTGASEADLQAAREYAEQQAEEARIAAEEAAALDATAKTEAAEARAAADAKTKADQALADAQAALADARGEITAEITASANGKNSITRSLREPSGDGVVHGDQWYQVDGDGDAFASWYWGASGWTPSLIKNEMMESLDVHKLKVTGDTTMNTAVIDKLWVDGLVGKTATFNQINVAAGNILIDPNGLNPALRSMVGGTRWTWDDTGKYWKQGWQPTGAPQFETYSRTGTVYDSNLLTPGAMYLLSWDIWVDSVGPNTGARASIYYRRADGSTAFVGDGLEDGGDTAQFFPVREASTWIRVQRFWRAPDDVISGGINFQLNYPPDDYTEVRVRNPFVGKQSSAVLIEDGAITTPKLTVTEDMSAAIVNAMSVNTKNLVVTESAILNHVTAIGQTVVDDINVQGKLIGTDGVFTGTVDFENINVTGDVLAESISGEYLYGTVVEGGEIRTDPNLPGQVTLGNDAFTLPPNGPNAGVIGPGISILPLGGQVLAHLPGIGADGDGMVLSGGEGLDGRRASLSLSASKGLNASYLGGGSSAVLAASPSGATLTSASSSDMASISAISGAAQIRAEEIAGASSAQIVVQKTQARLEYNNQSTGVNRWITVNSTGTWVVISRNGEQSNYNLEMTASDSGWQAIDTAPGFVEIPEGFDVRRVGRMTYFRGAVTGNVTTGWVTIGTVPEGFRPVVRQVVSGASSTIQNLMFQVYPSGAIQVKGNNSGTSLNIFVNVIFYPAD